MVHLVLNQLVGDNILEKLGQPPKTIYRLIKIKLEPITADFDFSKSQVDFLNTQTEMLTPKQSSEIVHLKLPKRLNYKKYFQYN